MKIPRYLVYLLLLVIAIVLPFIMRDDYLQHILVMTCIFAILAISLDIIVGYMGQISLGHTAFFGVGAYTSALLTVNFGVSPWLGWLAAIALAGLLGFIVGFIALRRIRGVSLAIVTFGFGLVLWLVSMGWFEVTHGWSGITRIPPPVIAIPGLPRLTFGTAFTYYYLALAVLILLIYLVRRLLRSKFGRAVIALRENESLASSIGVDAFRYYVITFALGSAIAGLAGAIFGHYIRLITPNLLGMNYLFVMFIMVIIGGKGTIPGPIIGAAIFVFVPELLRIAEEFRAMILGIVFLVAIIFMPSGVYPGLVSLWNRLPFNRGPECKIED